MKKKGFSLIEVVVVLVIISLSVILVAPSLSRFSSTAGLKATTKKLSAILRFYRSEAIHRGRVYRILFDSDLNEVRIRPVVPTEAVEEGVNKEESVPPKIYGIPKGIRIREVKVESTEYSSDFPTIEFYANGGSNGGTITLDNQDRQGFKIEVNFLTGIVTVQKI